jgi:hypothetical protein
MMLKAPFDLATVQPEPEKSDYKKAQQSKLASLRRERYHGTMSPDTYAIYRAAYLMTEQQAHQWRWEGA